MKAIPKKDWVWGGHAAHLCVRSECLFHLTTMVGKFTISTVGDYRPPQKDRLNAKPERIGSGPEDFYETFVFEGHISGDGCPDINNGNEVDARRYSNAKDANKGHIEMCEKYSRAH